MAYQSLLLKCSCWHEPTNQDLPRLLQKRDSWHCRLLFLLVALFAAAAPASAHHEAMFGPQSSAVLSPGVFLSAQVFVREHGKDDTRQRETTTVFSASVRPFKNPLSLALVVPVTFATATGAPSARGIEDALITARYRVDVDRVASALGLDEGYVMGVGGFEVPTGNMDHDFGRGPVGEIVAGLVGAEKRPVAALGYAYYRHTNAYRGTRQGGNIFAGAGVAYTPIDDDARGRLFSLQVGLSYEKTFAIERENVPLAESGASGVFLHPGVVFSTSPRVRFFGLVSLPMTQEWRLLEDRQRFRVGAGAIVVLGH